MEEFSRALIRLPAKVLLHTRDLLGILRGPHCLLNISIRLTKARQKTLSLKIPNVEFDVGYSTLGFTT